MVNTRCAGALVFLDCALLFRNMPQTLCGLALHWYPIGVTMGHIDLEDSEQFEYTRNHHPNL